MTGKTDISFESQKKSCLIFESQAALLVLINNPRINTIKDTNPNHEENGKAPTEIVRQLIIKEIQYLLKNCPNVRIMLTSRTDEINVSFTQYRFEKLYLTGLREDNIREYLANKKFTPEAIDAAIANERLLECLVIPLFLTMYADLRDVSGISSRGEILSKFFHERGDNIAYTKQEAIEKLKFNASQHSFILDFLLPPSGGRWSVT